MWLILLEALAALLLGVFIVWWTMFSGRRGGERPSGTPVSSTDGDSGSSKDAEPPAR